MTPRTDAKVFQAHWPTSWCRSEEGPVVDAAFARLLETELIEQTASHAQTVGIVSAALRERDEALRTLARLRAEPANGTGWKS